MKGLSLMGDINTLRGLIVDAAAIGAAAVVKQFPPLKQVDPGLLKDPAQVTDPDLAAMNTAFARELEILVAYLTKSFHMSSGLWAELLALTIAGGGDTTSAGVPSSVASALAGLTPEILQTLATLVKGGTGSDLILKALTGLSGSSVMPTPLIPSK